MYKLCSRFYVFSVTQFSCAIAPCPLNGKKRTQPIASNKLSSRSFRSLLSVLSCLIPDQTWPDLIAQGTCPRLPTTIFCASYHLQILPDERVGYRKWQSQLHWTCSLIKLNSSNLKVPGRAFSVHYTILHCTAIVAWSPVCGYKYKPPTSCLCLIRFTFTSTS